MRETAQMRNGALLGRSHEDGLDPGAGGARDVLAKPVGMARGLAGLGGVGRRIGGPPRQCVDSPLIRIISSIFAART
jgi:hypothetical protein